MARAVARVAAAHAGLRLMLVGPVPDGERLARQLERIGVHDRTRLVGRVALAELPSFIEAADVVAHLRYPTARETSAALLRVLAQGRPTIVSDLEQQAELPRDAVLRVDVADEDAGLESALRLLVQDSGRRDSLARNAAAYVAREHAPERVAAAWNDVFERARRAPRPAPARLAVGLAAVRGLTLRAPAGARAETERAFQAFARSGVDRLELHADAPGAAAADAALHAAAHASVEVGALAADEKVQVQRRVRCERDGRLQHQAARSDVQEPRAHDEHGLGQLGRLEARGLAALGLVGASGAHGTSRTTRKPQSAARACGSRHAREPGFSSRAGWRHDPPRLTRASPDSGPRGS